MTEDGIIFGLILFSLAIAEKLFAALWQLLKHGLLQKGKCIIFLLMLILLLVEKKG